MDAGNLSKEISQILQRKGFAHIGLRECGRDDLSTFSNALSHAIAHNRHGPYVDRQSPEGLEETGARVFLARDGKAGVAVWPDGNIGALFKDAESKNGRATGELLLTALSVGGSKLDCYDGFLANLYASFGFIPVARVKFDRKFASDDWRDEFGEPDVIFWMHCGDPVRTVAEKMNTYPFPSKSGKEALPVFSSYEEAYRYRDDRQAGRI